MIKNKIELLAPAGSYDIFLLALEAGADAVYFAGPKFGARAFAKNFTSDEIIRAIDLAHLFHKKVYLTINTLLKNLELQALYNFLLPFYIEGLDGVIVQDLGVLDYISKTFPDIELHASTQMTITGEHGITLLEKLNVKRVVLARELTLKEIKEIKEKTNMELEVFVHGAMCYSYSGQCLLSSVLGGRSGNRGRCAQPCRLPYQVDKNEASYPLSMKDQCAISFLEELIHIGVDSLKIEGRMKKEEYVVKVTSIYRKYIDMVYDKDERNDSSPLIIDKNDLEFLENLYVRNSVQNGYFKKQNNADMITLMDSAYKETPDSLLSKIHLEINNMHPLKVKLDCSVYLYVDKPIKLIITCNNKDYTFEGATGLLAINQPITEEKILKQMNKTNTTMFEFVNIHVQSDSKCFIPVSELNAVRRIALASIKEELLSKYKRTSSITKTEYMHTYLRENETVLDSDSPQITVLISTKEQLNTVISFHPKRIYIPIELFETLDKKMYDLMHKEDTISYFIALPYVLRQKDNLQINTWNTTLNNSLISGVLIRTIEEVGYLESINYNKIKQLDYLIYCMNTSSVYFWINRGYQWTSPIELNKKELNHLPLPNETMIYGRIPLMITANCISKTTNTCTNNNSVHTLTDRYKKDFKVQSNCSFCYNTLYNSVPLSLHKYILDFNIDMRLRIEFTFEDQKECSNICSYFFEKKYKDTNNQVIIDYTNGHYKRGID